MGNRSAAWIALPKAWAMINHPDAAQRRRWTELLASLHRPGVP